MTANYMVRSAEKSTKCICPKCGKSHKLKLYWTGRGIPKKYCQECKFYFERTGFGIDILGMAANRCKAKSRLPMRGPVLGDEQAQPSQWTVIPS
jgi:hypothetical protein